MACLTLLRQLQESFPAIAYGRDIKVLLFSPRVYLYLLGQDLIPLNVLLMLASPAGT